MRRTESVVVMRGRGAIRAQEHVGLSLLPPHDTCLLFMMTRKAAAAGNWAKNSDLDL